MWVNTCCRVHPSATSGSLPKAAELEQCLERSKRAISCRPEAGMI
jgi:hypothetical protein